MDQKHDRDMPASDMSRRQSHREKKRERKEMLERVKGSANERPPQPQGSEPRKLPIPD